MPAVVVEVVGDTKGLSKELKKAEGELKSFATKAEGLQNAVVTSTRSRPGTSTIDSRHVVDEWNAQRAAAKAAKEATTSANAELTKSATVSRTSARAVGGYTVAVIAAHQAVQAISQGLKVSGEEAVTSSGKWRNAAASLLNLDVVGAALAFDLQRTTGTVEQLTEAINKDNVGVSHHVGVVTRDIDIIAKWIGIDRQKERQLTRLAALSKMYADTIDHDLSEALARATFEFKEVDKASALLFGERGSDRGLRGPGGTGPKHTQEFLDRRAAQIKQRRGFFDANISRRIDRTQDLKGVRNQVAALRAIEAEIQKRIDATSDRTRQLELEDRLVQVQRRAQSLLDQQARDAASEAAKAAAAREREAREAAEKARKLAQARKDHLAALKEAADAARETHLGWLEFSLERAETTKTLKDDIKGERAVIKFYEQRIKVEGRKLELVRELWRHQQKLKDFLKQKQPAGTPFQGSIFRQAAPTLDMPAATLRRVANIPLPPPLQVGGGGTVISIGNLNLHGVQNVPALEDELVKRSKQRPVPRRGR